SRTDVPLVPMRYFLLVWLAECELRTNGCRYPGWNSLVDAGRIYGELIKEKEVISDQRLYDYCALRQAKVLYWRAVISTSKTDIETAIGANDHFIERGQNGV